MATDSYSVLTQSLLCSLSPAKKKQEKQLGTSSLSKLLMSETFVCHCLLWHHRTYTLTLLQKTASLNIIDFTDRKKWNIISPSNWVIDWWRTEKYEIYLVHVSSQLFINKNTRPEDYIYIFGHVFSSSVIFKKCHLCKTTILKTWI